MKRVRTAPPRWNLLAGGAALIVISLIWIAPLINENWLHGAVYGFGFVPRAEISQLADALRAASKPDDDVIAPSFVCFEAGRRELIRYPETYGVYREAKAEYDRDGFFAARRRLGAADFFQLIDDTRHFWTEQMRDAIASGKVSAVISDSPIQLLPLVLVPEDFLTSNGFRPTLTTDHFTLWTRTPAPSTPPTSRAMNRLNVNADLVPQQSLNAGCRGHPSPANVRPARLGWRRTFPPLSTADASWRRRPTWRSSRRRRRHRRVDRALAGHRREIVRGRREDERPMLAAVCRAHDRSAAAHDPAHRRRRRRARDQVGARAAVLRMRAAVGVAAQDHSVLAGDPADRLIGCRDCHDRRGRRRIARAGRDRGANCGARHSLQLRRRREW